MLLSNRLRSVYEAVNAVPPWVKLLFIPLVCGIAAVLKGQDINWDLQNYHLYNPYAFLHNRLTLDLAPAGLQSYFNPYLDLIVYGLWQLLPPIVVGALLGFVHGCNFLLLYQIAGAALPDSARRQRIAWWLAVAGVASVGFISELGVVMHDNLVSLPILAALLLVLREINGAGRAQMLVWAGVMAGVASALKLVVGVYALTLCLSMLVLPLPWHQKFRLAFYYCVGVGIGLLLTGGYWFYEIWSHFGNPIFPNFNNVFGGELSDPVTNRDDRFFPTSWQRFLIYPFLMSVDKQLVSELYYEQFSWGVIYIALILVAAKLVVGRVQQRRGISAPTLPVASCLLLAFLGFSLLLWLKLFSIYRYLITGELLLPLTLLLACSALWQRYGLQLGISLVGLLTLLNWSGDPDWGRGGWRSEPYSIERPADIDRVDMVLLAGQPLGWLVPALDLPIPFLQVLPNFYTVHSAYGATLMARMRQAETIRVVFDAQANSLDQLAEFAAVNGYVLQQANCQPLAAFLGGAAFTYQYCPVTRAAIP